MATQKQWFSLLDTDAKALRSWLVFTISSGGMTGALTFPSSLKVTLKEDNSFFMGIDTEEEKGILWLEWINPGNNSLQVQPRYVTPTGLGPTLSRFAVALFDAMARAWPDSKEQINEALEALGLKEAQADELNRTILRGLLAPIIKAMVEKGHRPTQDAVLRQLEGRQESPKCTDIRTLRRWRSALGYNTWQELISDLSR